MAARKDDLLWKGIIEDIFDDFLRFFIPDADSIFDFGRKPQFLDKEMEQLFPPEGDEFSPKVVDKLVQVFTKDGGEEWILLHIEVQGQYQKDFSERMYRYYARIFDKYNRSITAFAIFTEASTKPRPDTYQREYLGTKLLYKFNAYKIAAQSDEELLASDNPFALVVAVAKTAFAGRNIKDSRERDELLLNLKRPLARELLLKDIPKEKIRVLMNFLRYYVRFDNEEFNVIFEKEVKDLTERTDTMGIEQLLLERAEKQGEKRGEKKGELKERARAEAKILEEKRNIAREFKKLSVPVADIAKGTGLSVEEIERL